MEEVECHAMWLLLKLPQNFLRLNKMQEVLQDSRDGLMAETQ